MIILTRVILVAALLLQDILTNELSFLLCDTSFDYVDRLIKDCEASGRNSSSYRDIREFCRRRDQGDHPEVPIHLELRKVSHGWLSTFTYSSYPKVYEESEPLEHGSFNGTLGKNDSKRYWYLYRITRTPFYCQTCRIGIYLRFNVSMGFFNIKYGYQRILFSRFIDYTRDEAVKREDKSNYLSVNIEFMKGHNVGSSEEVYFDDNFFGSKDQHFLIGIAETDRGSRGKFETKEKSLYSIMQTVVPFLRSSVRPISVFDSVEDSHQFSSIELADNQAVALRLVRQADAAADEHTIDLTAYRDFEKPEIASHTKAPLISVSYCYTRAGSKFSPSILCYPFINRTLEECICWSRNPTKTLFIVALFTAIGLCIFAIIFFHYKFPKKIKEVTIFSDPARPEICDKNIKLQLTCGYMADHRLPGPLDLELKRAGDNTFHNIRIKPEFVWSNPNLFTNDTNYLLVNYRLPQREEKPRFIEVTFYQSVTAPRNLLYLYGITVETPTTKETYPHAHYLENRRTVRLSASEEWVRALRRMNRTTRLPVVLQKVQSLTMIERLLLLLVNLRFLGPRLLLLVDELEEDLILATVFESLSGVFLLIIILTGYIVVFKRQNGDRYDVMPISSNHQTFSFVLGGVLILTVYDFFNFLPVVGDFIWRGKKFNREIASRYTQVVWAKDVKWIIAMAGGAALSATIMTGIEKIIVRLNKPDKSGPLAFEIGHSDGSSDEDFDANLLART